MNENPISTTASPPNVDTGQEFDVTFEQPGALRWLASPPKTRWRWTGAGIIQFEGADTLIRGRRRRPLWFSAAQEVRFASRDVQNVAQNEREISCEVKLPPVISGLSETRVERLKCWATDSAAAKTLVSHWPRDRTPEYSRLLADKLAFSAALESVGTKSAITQGLVAVNVLVFVLLVFKGINAMTPSGADLIPWGSNYGAQTIGGEWWRLFTSMFLHFGLVHLLLNMWALASIGPMTERLLGSGRFLLLYLFAGLCGSVASLLWNPNVNSAGASGAVFGVIGGLLAIVVNPKTKIPTTVSSAQRNSALVFIAYNLMNGISHPGIDNACHIGGLVGGFAMGWLLARPLNPEARRNGFQGLLVGTFMGALAIYALAWPLAHPSPERLAAQALQRALVKFSSESKLADSQEKQLKDMLDAHTISEEQWGRMTLTNVVPYWQTAEDEFVDLKVPSGTKYEEAKQAVVQYLTARRLGVEYRAEAARDHDKSKADWANELLQRSRERDAIAAGLLKKLR